MRVHLHRSTREASAVNQRGMVERLREHRDVALRTVGQGTQDAQISHVAGAKVKRSCRLKVRRKHGGELFFQSHMRLRVTADEVRCTAARTVQRRTFFQRLHHQRVGGKAQVIVAVECQHGSAVHHQVRLTRGLGAQPCATQALGINVGQLG